MPSHTARVRHALDGSGRADQKHRQQVSCPRELRGRMRPTHGVDGVHEGLAADVLHARPPPRGAVHRAPPLPPPVVHRA